MDRAYRNGQLKKGLLLLTAVIFLCFMKSVPAAGATGEAVSGRLDIARDAILAGNGREYYDFTKDRKYGCSFSGKYGLDFEGTCGFALEVLEDGVYCTPYRHSDRFDAVTIRVDQGEVYNLDWDKSYRILTDGWEANTVHPVKMTATHQFSRNTFVCEGYLCKAEDGQIYTCRKTRKGSIQKDRNPDIMKDANPGEYLSNEKITYPTSGMNGNCNHVRQWERIADRLLCGHEDWSDEYKVYVFQEYLNQNYAFDTYRSKVIDPESRASIVDIWNDDSYFMLGNRVGVCWDFVNVMTIMCRHVGIPATSIENSHHTVVAVYLRDEWATFDITDTVRYICGLEDPSREKWARHSHVKYDTYGEVPTYEFETRDESIWTKEKAWIPDDEDEG